jgi:hypothetical protein
LTFIWRERTIQSQIEPVALAFIAPTSKPELQNGNGVARLAVGFVFAVMGKTETVIILSGVPWWHRVVGAVIEFDDYVTALACYRSPNMPRRSRSVDGIQ